MRNLQRYLLLAAVGIIVASGLYCVIGERPEAVGEYESVARPPRIFPDYSDTVIPPNVAPLNFVVREEAEQYRVRVSSTEGEPIEIAGRDPRIAIPTRKWKALLQANAGRRLSVEVYAKGTRGPWRRFATITNTIAREPIDRYLVYHLIPPIHHLWDRIGIYQRNLEGFTQTTVLSNRSFGGGCVNCHTFRGNAPDEMTLQIRSKTYGLPTLIARGKTVQRVDMTSSGFSRAAGYASWHPAGRLIAFSGNRFSQFHHTTGENRDVWDAESRLAVYDLPANRIISHPGIAAPDRRETWPSWSADGRTLYFASGPPLPRERFREVRYDLMRIGFDAEKSSWGEPETLVAAATTGLSASQPRESPGGRWLLFCLANYGSFLVFQPSSDLYLMDLRTGRYRRLDINSDRCDSWHGWSSNGRCSSQPVRLAVDIVRQTGGPSEAPRISGAWFGRGRARSCDS